MFYRPVDERKIQKKLLSGEDYIFSLSDFDFRQSKKG